MSKFKVGDNVRVLRNTSLEKRKDAYIGKEFTIKNLQGESMFSNGTRYDIGELYVVYENEIELATPRHEIHITCTDRRTTHAVKKVDGKIVARSNAICCSADEFDFNVGAQLAFNRLVYGTDYHPSEVALKPKQPKREDKPKFKVGDKVKFVKTQYDFKDYLVGRTYEIKNIQGACEDGFRYGIGEMHVAFESELEPYTEPESTEPKQEPVKLYCFKSFPNLVTAGKIYEVRENGRLVFDNGRESSYDWKSKIPSTWPDSICKLVSRPAKVGEWVYVTSDKVDGVTKGEVCEVISLNDNYKYLRTKAKTIYGWHEIQPCTLICDTNYLVLDGYKPEPEKAEPEYLNMRVVCVAGSSGFTVGKVYEFKNGVVIDDDGDLRPRSGNQKITSLDDGYMTDWENKFIEFKGE